MDDLTTERSFDSQATWVADVLCLYFDILFKSACTTRHWQTSGRLAQELCVCPVLLQCPATQSIGHTFMFDNIIVELRWRSG